MAESNQRGSQEQTPNVGDLRRAQRPRTRSLLVASAGKPGELERALACGADAIVVDLQGPRGVTADADDRRRRACDFLTNTRRQADRPLLIVRVNALDGGLIDDDLAAVMSAAPDAIMLPNCRHGADVQHLSVKLAVHEALNDLTEGATRVLPIVAQTPDALFGLQSYAGASPRLYGLTWDADALAGAVRAETARLQDGSYADPYRLARALTLMAACGARIEPIDGAFTDLRDEAGLRAECIAARRDGFRAKLAIDSTQVAIIHEVFGSV